MKNEIKIGKRYVLAGGPCSGKSTLIQEFKKRGYSVLEEVARQVLEERKNYIPDKEEIIERQKLIFNRQIKQEESYDKDKILFLDRGLPEVHAYSSYLLGFIPKEIQSDLSRRYNSIFLLDRLPFFQDGLRIEDNEQEAKKIHEMIINAYRGQRYSPIFVPVMPIDKRADYILNCLGRKDGMYRKDL